MHFPSLLLYISSIRCELKRTEFKTLDLLIIRDGDWLCVLIPPCISFYLLLLLQLFGMVTWDHPITMLHAKCISWSALYEIDFYREQFFFFLCLRPCFLLYKCHAPKPTLRAWRSFHISNLKAQNRNNTNIHLVTRWFPITKFLFKMVK